MRLLLVVGVVLLTSGVGAVAFVPFVVCMGMMGVMMVDDDGRWPAWPRRPLRPRMSRRPGRVLLKRGAEPDHGAPAAIISTDSTHSAGQQTNSRPTSSSAQSNM